MVRSRFPLIHIFLWKTRGFRVNSLWTFFSPDFVIFSHVDNRLVFQKFQKSFQQPYSRRKLC